MGQRNARHSSECLAQLEQCRYGLFRIKRLRRDDASHDKKAWLAEASHRLKNLGVLIRRIDALHRHLNRPTPTDIVKWDTARIYRRGRAQQAATDELLTLVEAFYYFGFRLRQVVRRLPGFSRFEAPGVRDVRNHLLEHPEGHPDRRLSLSFSFGDDMPSGPQIKPIGARSTVSDRGLFINASELATNLSLAIARVRKEDA